MSIKPLRLLPLFLVTGALLLAGEKNAPLEIVKGRAPLDLTLDQAVQMALRQNPQILNAEQEIERVRGQVIEVRAQALPHISLSASYEQESKSLVRGGSSGAAPQGQSGASATPVPAVSGTNAAPVSAAAAQAAPAAAAADASPSPSPSAAPSPSPSGANSGFVQNKSWQITIQATQVLYAGGQVRAGLRIAKLTEDVSIFKLRDTVDTVISTVRQQFYQVLVNKALITVQQESVRLLQSQLADQKNRFEAGTVPRFNVLQAEVALANAQPALIAARNNYHIAQLQLAKTLGYETHTLAAREEPFNAIGELTVPPVRTPLADALQQARERRAFLKAQRLNILIEVQDIIVQAAGYKPTLTANGGYTVENDRLSRSLGDTVHGWFFGVQGNWNLFDGFETYGKVKQARARLEKAHIAYDDSVDKVDLEVQQAWASLEQARETIASQQKNVEQATEAVRLSRERLGAGAGTQLDVLNSTVALTQAQTTELQARFDYNTALAEFDRVTAADTRYTETFKDPLTQRPKRALWQVSGSKPGEKVVK